MPVLWQRSQTYGKGHVVTHDGSMFTAVRNVADGEQPGKVIDAWQLSAKVGGQGVMKGLNRELEKQVREAHDAAQKAVAASAAVAKRAAERAEFSAQARKHVERTVVTGHDEAGRILSFEKEIVEKDA